MLDEPVQRPVVPRAEGACRGDSPRGLDNVGQHPRRVLCSHGYGAVRRWRRVPGAPQPGKFRGFFQKSTDPYKG